jgi:hypothetical protein
MQRRRVSLLRSALHQLTPCGWPCPQTWTAPSSCQHPHCTPLTVPPPRPPLAALVRRQQVRVEAWAAARAVVLVAGSQVRARPVVRTEIIAPLLALVVLVICTGGRHRLSTEQAARGRGAPALASDAHL